MPYPIQIPGVPGIRAAISSAQKILFKGGLVPGYLARGVQIDGSLSRDPTNSPVTMLQVGLLMGKVTATGLYAPSIIGPTTASYTSGGTSLTVAAATATELIRRIGTSGTFKLVGPAVASTNPVQVVTVTYSAVGSTTITITSPGVSFISGAFICPTDGSEDMLSVIADGYPIPAVDGDGTTNITNQWPLVAIEGPIISSAIVNWPSDTVLQNYIVNKLSAPGAGKFVFDHVYLP